MHKLNAVTLTFFLTVISCFLIQYPSVDHLLDAAGGF